MDRPVSRTALLRGPALVCIGIFTNHFTLLFKKGRDERAGSRVGQDLSWRAHYRQDRPRPAQLEQEDAEETEKPGFVNSVLSAAFCSGFAHRSWGKGSNLLTTEGTENTEK